MKRFSIANVVGGISLPPDAIARLHADQHPRDVRHPRGFQRVRLDGGNSKTPTELREYTLVKTGFGEGTRAALARQRFFSPLRKGGL
jgi:hypothetical protein